VEVRLLLCAYTPRGGQKKSRSMKIRGCD
jgi:hypothetical protein